MDQETVRFYNAEARDYARYAAGERRGPWLETFLERLAPGARVLDFGCGSGWAAASIVAAGHEVAALDASQGLAAEASARYGLAVRTAAFSEFDERETFDAVWASFSLLHDTRTAFPGHIARLAAALRPGGLLYLGLKEGTGRARDRLGRLYTYFCEDEIREALDRAGFAPPEIDRETGTDYAGAPTRFLHVFARRR
ncbi:MAG: class I SAM-dependent methyltransferase [Paracoccaceae bacterium]